MHTLNNIKLVHYSNDLLKIVSKSIAKQTKHLLPDLRKVTVFLPNQLSQRLLRDEILREIEKQGYAAIFPPTLTTLQQWARKEYKINKPILSQYARELILVDAIKQQPVLFSSANPWSVANELLCLFDAMLLNNIKPLEFNNYYLSEDKVISHVLLYESDLVKLLWEAWLHQTTNENFLDPIQAYIDALNNIKISNEDIFFCVGLDQLSKLESNFLNRIDKQSKLFFYVYASNKDISARTDFWLKKYLSPDTHFTLYHDKENNLYSNLLDDVYTDNKKSIKQRAENFANNYPDPIKDHLNIYKSNSFEQHTKAIDVQIRIWINKNIHNIGIVTTDRKLVRRLRAVLEHANIAVNDSAGWALATTSAAVVVEWWLQLIEEKYPAKQLLALANSPFFLVDDKSIHEQAIIFFEKEVILALKIHNGIHNFRSAIEKIQSKNTAKEEYIYEYLSNLLDKFEASTQLLAKLYNHKNYPLHRFIKELINSLKQIGLYTTLTNDDAGKQIIDLLEDQVAHFKLVNNNLSWSESRRFLSRVFDQQNYKPPTAKTCVTFCSLEQSRLQSFDALIIASVDKNNFPGTSSNYIFFNEQVRAELNIPTWRDDNARHLHQFRCLLDGAKKILITVQTEQNGEKTTPSPWLEAIETFYHIAYKKDLTNNILESLVEEESTSVRIIPEIPFPSSCTQPSPVLTPELIPDSISISQYQTLVNCPYQYFTLSCLKLSQTKELEEKLGKADFGSLVHQSIHAFFSNQPNLPGPFYNRITTVNRKDAEDMLRLISKQIFSRSNAIAINNDFNNELWLQRWLNLIPKFIDWEIKRQENYIPQYHEISRKLIIDDSSQVHGRLDRVDKSGDGFAVIDYKTGITPPKKSILAGEQVQLPMYALLNESNTGKPTTQVEFVSIGENNLVKSLAIIKDDELSSLKIEHLHRLRSFFINLNKGAKFTALATDDECERCDAFGVCRKYFWQSSH